MNEVPQITLDSNCIINLLDFNSKTATSVDYLSEIIKLSFSSKVNIAITTRVETDFENDKDETRRTEMMRKISLFPVVGTIARWGVSRWGQGDMWGGEKTEALQNELQKIIFPGGLNEESSSYTNKRNDLDHLVGHIINKRDIFVTDDGDILKKRDVLSVSPGIVVMSPNDCLDYLQEIEDRGKRHILQKGNQVVGYHSPALIGKVTFDYSNNNGSFIIGEGYFLFETKWSKASGDSIYGYSDGASVDSVALAKGIADIEMVVDASIFDYTSRCRTINEGGILLLKNTNNIFAAIKVIDIQDDSRSDDKDELTFEYYIQSDGSVSFSTKTV